MKKLNKTEIQNMLEIFAQNAEKLTYHFDYIRASKYVCTQIDAHKLDVQFILHVSIYAEIETKNDTINDCEYAFCMSTIAAYAETLLSRSDLI